MSHNKPYYANGERAVVQGKCPCHLHPLLCDICRGHPLIVLDDGRDQTLAGCVAEFVHYQIENS